MSEVKKPPVDNPIQSSKEDVLGRAVVAQDFARSIRDLDASQGIVVGVLGAWGHGKSSFVNLMKEEFSSDPEFPVVEFNPWLFSGSQQLTDVFFREIAAELRVKNGSKFAAIAEGLDKYGDVLSPVAIIPWFGAWWDRAFRASRAAATWWSNRKRGSRPFREEITEALLKLEQPIVVVIDDIDRLTTAEIRDIFKLVRLTASFPNIVYILAFDRRRIEKALSEDGVPGRDYLEKIVQLSFDLPAIPRELLRSQVFAKLDPILEGVTDLRFKQEDWPDIYFEIIEPLISSLRDVTRLTISARTTIQALGSQIETVDLMALEAVRIFRPEIFEELQRIRSSLTGVSDSFGSVDTTRQQGEVEQLLKVAGDEAELVRHLISRVFPAARRFTERTSYGRDSVAIWKREHRLAHISYFDLYLGRTAPNDLITFSLAEKAYAYFADSDALGEFLDAVPSEQLEDVFSGFEAYQNEYPLESVVPASIALLNRIHKIPEREHRGMFDIMRPHLIVGRVVLRLLLRIEDAAERESAVSAILPHLVSYSTQRDFIQTVGYQEGAGHKLVSEQVASDLEAEFAARVQAGESPVLEDEWDLLRVYWQVAEHLGEDYVAPALTQPDEVRALIRTARSVARSQSFDSRTVREEEHLAWEPLVRVAGGKDQLLAAIERLREADGDTPLIQLADRYSGGWRPKDF